MNKYLLSVIIPTRNRQKYAEAAVRQILGLHQDIQVVLQDNSDDDTLQTNLTDLLGDEHLIYHHIQERIAFIDNYEYAAENASGEYLLALGDDDGVLSNITECVNWMKNNNIDALMPSVKACYFWPDSNSKSEKIRNGIFNTTYFTGQIHYYNTRESVIDLLKVGGQNYLSFPLAGTYHRIVRMDMMKKVKEKTGRYYAGLTPDMYSAICLSLLPNIKFVEIDYPISLPGVCPSSASAKSAKGEHSGELSTAPHFIGLTEPYHWDERIPKYYSVETIWAETMIKACILMGEESLINQYFNKDYLLFQMYESNPNRKDDLIDLIGEDKITQLEIKYNTSKKNDRISTFFNKGCKYLIRRIPGNSIVYQQCNNIQEATSAMNSMINSKIMRMKWKKIQRHGRNAQ